VWGFARHELREKPAAWLYTDLASAPSAHVVDKCLDLAEAAGARRHIEFPIPAGRPEGVLPEGPFVLASPLAGWAAKQWPLASYSQLAARLKVPLVLNGPPGMTPVAGTLLHVSGIAGLIDATRRATAVIGVDSGPLHLAAALGKPGVAIFGPTDPARNGPYGGTIEVLRSASAATTYRRDSELAASMQDISPDSVMDSLCRVISSQNLTPIS
jgi:heptosyltransferase-1